MEERHFRDISIVKRRRIKRILQFLGILITLSLTIPALYLLAPEPPENPAAGWEGAFPLLIRRAGMDVPPEQLLPVFEDDFVLSRQNVMVSFTVFGGMEQVSLSELPHRLLPEDPRYDPYMKSVDRFFQSPSHPDWEVVYYISELSEPQFVRHISALQSEYPEGILYVRNRSLPAWVRPFIYAAGLSLLVLGLASSGRHRFWVTLAGVPLVVTAHAGNPVVFCSIAVAFCIWQRGYIQLAERLRFVLHHPGTRFSNPGTRRAIVSGALLLPALPLGVGYFSGQAILVAIILLTLVLQVLVSILGLAWIRLLEQRRDHRIFLPVSIRPRYRIKLVEFAPVLLLICAGSMFLFILGEGRGNSPGWQAMKIPQPVTDSVQSGGSHDLEHDELVAGIIDLAAQRGLVQYEGTALPGLADFIAHRAYQTAFAYGRPYGFPQLDESVLLSGFQRNGSGLEMRDEVRFQFTNSWLSDTVQQPPGTIEQLLLNQGYSAAFHNERVEPVFFDVPAISWTLILALAVLLFHLPWKGFVFFNGIPRLAVAKSSAVA